MPQTHNLRENADEHLRLAINASHIGIWELDTETGEAWRNLTHDQIFGYDELLESWTFKDFIAHVVEEDRDEVAERYAHAVETGEEWAFECRIRRKDGMIRWISAQGKQLSPGVGKARLIGHVLDITQTKRSEEHLRLVTEELNHRLKNIIASISALIGRASRQEGDRVEIARSLQARLAAIGRSHTLAYRDRRASVPLLEVIETELIDSNDLADQFAIDVDGRMVVPSDTAERLTLVLHELVTNAVKYGALSVPEGRVHVGSHVRDGGEVELAWRESLGPIVREPDEEGFGSTLIRHSLGSDAMIERSFPPDGAICKIVFPARVVGTRA